MDENYNLISSSKSGGPQYRTANSVQFCLIRHLSFPDSATITYYHSSSDVTCHARRSEVVFGAAKDVPGSAPGCRTGNGEKLSSTQAEPVQAIKSGVAYLPSISCTTSWRRSRYPPLHCTTITIFISPSKLHPRDDCWKS